MEVLSNDNSGESKTVVYNRTDAETTINVYYSEFSKCCSDGENLFLKTGMNTPDCVPSSFNATPEGILSLRRRRMLCDQPYWLYTNDTLGQSVDGLLQATSYGQILYGLEHSAIGNNSANGLNSHTEPDSIASATCLDLLVVGQNSSTSPATWRVAAGACSLSSSWQPVSLLQLEVNCRSAGALCLRKCCSDREQISLAADQTPCVPATMNSSAWLDKFSRYSTTVRETRVVHGAPRCDDKKRNRLWTSSYSNNEIFHIDLDKSSILLPQMWTAADPSQYCTDLAQTSQLAPRQLVVFYCEPPQPLALGSHGRLQYNVLNYPAACASMACLTALVAVYALVPRLRTLHGKCQLCLALCYLLMYCVNIARTHVAATSNATVCYITCIALYYMMNCCRSWLIVGCYDMYRAFRASRRFTRGDPEVRKRFLKYSLLAWSLPLLPTALFAFFVVSVSFPDQVSFTALPFWLRYPIHRPTCWVLDPIKRLVYIDAPAVVLMLIDIVLMLMTMCSICFTQRQTRTLTANYRNCLHRYRLYWRLVLSSGVTTLLMAISAHANSSLFWTVLEPIYYLHGVVLFVLLSTSHQNRRLIATYYRKMRTGSSRAGSGNTNRRTYSYNMKDIGDRLSAGARSQLGRGGGSGKKQDSGRGSRKAADKEVVEQSE